MIKSKNVQTSTRERDLKRKFCWSEDQKNFNCFGLNSLVGVLVVLAGPPHTSIDNFEFGGLLKTLAAPWNDELKNLKGKRAPRTLGVAAKSFVLTIFKLGVSNISDSFKIWRVEAIQNQKGSKNSLWGPRNFWVRKIQAENENRLPWSEELKKFKGKRAPRTKDITTHAFELGVLMEILWCWAERAFQALIGRNFRNAKRRRVVLITLFGFRKVAKRVGSRLQRKFVLDWDAKILRNNCLTSCRTISESVCVKQQSSGWVCEHFARKNSSQRSRSSHETLAMAFVWVQNATHEWALRCMCVN